MKHFFLFGVGCAVLLTASLAAAARAQGRRAPSRSITPEIAAACRMVNVKAAPYNARGDGRTDDTAAIQRAISDWSLGNTHNDGKGARILYFPEGTYLVSKTLDYRAPDGTATCFLTLQGQSRERTVLRLKDGAFTDPNSPQPLVRTNNGWGDPKAGTGNTSFRNNLFDLTLDTGRANPGAIGLDYLASNIGAVENVLIRSGDGSGVAGVSMRRDWPGPCLLKNLEVSGFDFGVDVWSGFTGGNVFEHLTLRDQRVCAFRNRGNQISMRGLRTSSTSGAPAIINEGGGLITVVDADLSGRGRAAIVNEAALLARNVRSRGFGRALRSLGRDVPGARLAEFVSHTLGDSLGVPARTLGLPIRETPVYWDANTANWANIESFGAKPNDAGFDSGPAIQRALDSGRSTVLLPKGDYFIRDTLTVRGNVRHIYGAGSRIYVANGHAFTDEANPRPLVRIETTRGPLALEFLDISGTTASKTAATFAIENASAGEVTLRHVDMIGRQGSYRNSAPRNGRRLGALFLEDVTGVNIGDGPPSNTARENGDARWHFGEPQDVWARQWNPEMPTGPMIFNRGGAHWILGLKTENKATVLHTTGGGRTELLGGYFYPIVEGSEENPAILNDNSQVSASFIQSDGGEHHYEVLVRELRGGAAREVRRSAGFGRAFALYSGTAAPARR